MPKNTQTNPWGDAANQAVGALYKYYMSQPTAQDQLKQQYMQAQIDRMGTQNTMDERQMELGNYALPNLSPEIRNDMYYNQRNETQGSEAAARFGRMVNPPMQIDAGDSKIIYDSITNQPINEFGVGVAPTTQFDKENNRTITMPAVPATNRPKMPIADLFGSVINAESGGDPMALSPKGAAGIAQIMPDTARQPGYGVQPLAGWDGVDPRTAPVEEQMRFGQDYLGAMINERGGNVAEGVAAYNAGPGAVQQHGGIPPFAETQNYVQKVMGGAGQPQQVQQPSASTVQPDGTIITELPKPAAVIAQENKTANMKEIQTDLVNDDISRALSSLDGSMPVTGMVGSATKGIPGTPAHNFGETLSTIEANIGFDKLQAMRDASKTGGALGSIAVEELRMLQAVFGSVKQSQSEEQLRYNLMRLHNAYNDIVHGQGTGERYDVPSINKIMQMQSPEEIQGAMEFFNYNPPDDIENAIVQRANQLGL